MATNSPKEQKHTLASITLVLLMFGTLAALAAIPVQSFEAVRSAEQTQIREWLGPETDQWIMLKIFEWLQWVNSEAASALESSQVTGHAKIDGWLVQRVHAILIWCHVVLYRAGFLLMWGGFAIPVIAAAFMDAHYQREISKATFRSQSPVMHKYGIDASKITVIALIAWLFIPAYITMFVAPSAMLLVAFAGWVWISNKQKRL